VEDDAAGIICQALQPGGANGERHETAGDRQLFVVVRTAGSLVGAGGAGGTGGCGGARGFRHERAGRGDFILGVCDAGLGAELRGAGDAVTRGRSVQIDPIKPKLKPPGIKRLKLNCDMLLSTSAFRINLRRYSAVVRVGRDMNTQDVSNTVHAHATLGLKPGAGARAALAGAYTRPHFS